MSAPANWLPSAAARARRQGRGRMNLTALPILALATIVCANHEPVLFVAAVRGWS